MPFGAFERLLRSDDGSCLVFALLRLLPLANFASSSDFWQRLWSINLAEVKFRGRVDAWLGAWQHPSELMDQIHIIDPCRSQLAAAFLLPFPAEISSEAEKKVFEVRKVALLPPHQSQLLRQFKSHRPFVSGES